MELTQDPFVIIQYRGEDFVIYQNVVSDICWIIWGKCTENGDCVVGAVYPDCRPSTERPDIPVTPDIECNGCPLRGEWL